MTRIEIHSADFLEEFDVLREALSANRVKAESLGLESKFGDLLKAAEAAANEHMRRHNDFFARFGPEVAQRIEQGQDIHLALSSTGVFPIELLDNIAVGEESGRLAETMQHQAAEYQERAGSAISILAQIAGYIIWLLIVSLIVLLIFRLFSFYTGVLQDAAQPL